MKNLTKRVFLILLFSGLLYSQQREKVALVLSGGGVRGAGHIGVLRALEEENIRVDVIYGSSFGALIGGLYAIGYSSSEIEEKLKNIDWNKIYNDSPERANLFFSQRDETDKALLELRFSSSGPTLPLAFSSGQRLRSELTKVVLSSRYGNTSNFEDFKICLRIVASDLLTGKTVVIRNGDLAEAIQSSISVPMLYMPVEKDSMLLVDGGLTNNLPVDIAKAGGATLIIASDLSSPLRNKKEINAPWKVADQVMGIMMKSRLVEKRKEADILIRPDLGHFLPGEWDKIDFAIEQSYLTAVKVLRNNEKIAELKRENKNLYYWKICKYKIPKTEFINYIVNVTGNGPSSRDKSLLKQIYALMDSVKLLNSPLDEDLQRDIRTILVNSGYQYTKLSCGINGEILTIKLIDPKLESVVLHGLEKTKHLIIKRELELQPGEYLNYSKLLNSYYNVYNTNLFKSVGMNLMPGSADSLVSLNITVKEKKAGVFRLGLRYDNTRFARSFLDLSDQNTFGYGIRNKISVELGEMNRGIEIESNSDRLGYTNLSAGLNLYNRIRENRRYEGNEHKINYMDHRTGVTMWFGAEVEQIGLVKISWNYDRLMSRYDSLYADRNLEFYRLGLTSMEDKRDSRIFPTRGTFNQWRLETGHYVETSSTSYTYIKFFLHLSKWYSLTTNNAFGGYLQTGISDINVPYENFFEWGGWDKMPGYVDREKAGRNFWLLRLDYRYRLVIDLPPDIYFHLAAAAGKSNLSPDDYLNFTQIVTGFEAGVSLKTFFGPIQLFYGWNSDKIQRVYFNAGFPF